MSYSNLGQLNWIDVSPYDQVLTGLVDLCQKRKTSLICVQGPRGAGKSRVLAELLSSLSFDKTASLITLTGRSDEVFCHNVHISARLLDLQSSEFLNNFTLTLEAILEAKQHFYILIDNVEALPYELLEGMVEIIVDNEAFKEQVTLVIFMRELFAQAYTARLLSSAEVVTLSPMSIMEAKEFIDKVYQCMNINRQILINDVVRLHHLSYGYVGRILKLLEREPPLASKKYFKYHYLRLAMLGIVIVSVLLIFYGASTLLTKKNPEGEVVLDLGIEEVPSAVAVTRVEPLQLDKEPVVVKVLLPIQTAAEYDAMNELTEVKRLLPILQENDTEMNQITAQSMTQTVSADSDSADHQADGEGRRYVIELGRRSHRADLENLLRGRMIPGKAQFKLINDDGSKVWVAYIGPYGSKEQAEQGQKRLPASLQQLSLKVNKEF